MSKAGDISFWRDCFQYGQVVFGVLLALSAAVAMHLQKKVDRERAAVQESTEREQQRALIDANSKLAESNVRLSDLQQQIQPFLELAAKKYPGKQAEQALDALRDDIERVRTDAAQLRQTVAPRTVTTEVRAALSAIAAGIGPRKIKVTVGLNESEPAGFADALGKVFQDAGWTISDKVTAMVPTRLKDGSIGHGVYFRVPRADVQQMERFGQVLINAGFGPVNGEPLDDGQPIQMIVMGK